VDFLEGGLAPGKSTYFSLEGAVSLTCEGESCTSGPPSEGAATSLTTSLSGGGQEGAEITVPAGAAVTDQATLAGENASSAEGTVSYAVYSDPECSELAADAGTVKVSEGEAAPSEPQILYVPGTCLGGNFVIGATTACTPASECRRSKPPPNRMTLKTSSEM
jgi:hypothetical protein